MFAGTHACSVAIQAAQLHLWPCARQSGALMPFLMVSKVPYTTQDMPCSGVDASTMRPV